MSVFSLGEFAAHLMTMDADVKLAEEAAVVKGCKVVRRAAKGMLGHPQPFWAPLKPETIAHKAKGNTPLLETGEMKRSIEITAPVHEGRETVGYVGSNNMKTVWHELGTSRIPPRPFLSSAAMGREHEIHEMMAHMVASAMVLGGPNYRFVREILHTLHEAGKELWDEFGPEDEDEGKRK